MAYLRIRPLACAASMLVSLRGCIVRSGVVVNSMVVHGSADCQAPASGAGVGWAGGAVIRWAGAAHYGSFGFENGVTGREEGIDYCTK